MRKMHWQQGFRRFFLLFYFFHAAERSYAGTAAGLEDLC